LAQAVTDDYRSDPQNGDQEEKGWDDHVDKRNRIGVIIPNLRVAESPEKEEPEYRHPKQ
jgi:hypothetical protein